MQWTIWLKKKGRSKGRSKDAEDPSAILRNMTGLLLPQGWWAGDPGQASGPGIRKARPPFVTSVLGIICRDCKTLPSSHSFYFLSPARLHALESALPVWRPSLLDHNGQNCGMKTHSLPRCFSPVLWPCSVPERFTPQWLHGSFHNLWGRGGETNPNHISSVN